MTPRTAALPALIAVHLLSGCSGGDPDWYLTWGDPASPWNDEDGVYQGPTIVDEVYLNCDDEESGTWTYGAYTFGWTTGATLTAHLWYPESQEQHPLETVSRGDDAQWEHLYKELALSEQTEAGVATAFDCNYELMSWRIDIVDLEGAESDCIVFGYDVSKVNQGGDCRVFGLLGGG